MDSVIGQPTIEFIFTIFTIIAFAGPIVAEAFKKIVKGVRVFKTGNDNIKINPWFMYGIVALIDIPASIIFTLVVIKQLWVLTFAPVFVLATSIVAYDVIIKNILDLFEAVGMFLKRLIVGNKKEVAINEGIIKANGFDKPPQP